MRFFLKELLTRLPLKCCIRGWLEMVADTDSLFQCVLRDASATMKITFSGGSVPKSGTLTAGDYVEISGMFTQNKDGLCICDGALLQLIAFPRDKCYLMETENQTPAEARLNPSLMLRQGRMQRNLALVDQVYDEVCQILRKKYFRYVETPLLSKSVYEYTRNDFEVRSPLWGTSGCANLVQSPQLYKQVLMGGGVERYFQLAKNFRAEPGDETHLQEFTQLCVEMYTEDREEIISLMEEIVCRIFYSVLKIQVPHPFVRVAHDSQDSASTIVDRFSIRWIVKNHMARRKGGRIIPNHHIMTMPMPEFLDRLHQPDDLLSCESSGFDLEINGIEVAGGDMRITDAALQKRILFLLGYSPDEIETYYHPLLRMLENGLPQHGGFAFGLSRLCMLLAGEYDIHRMIAFPTDEFCRSEFFGYPF